jgi:hypothetical protein
VITYPVGGFPTFEKAEAGFMYLLKRERIDDTWTWDQTMRKIIMDPLYKSLTTLSEKRAAFEKVRFECQMALTTVHLRSRRGETSSKGCAHRQSPTRAAKALYPVWLHQALFHDQNRRHGLFARSALA